MGREERKKRDEVMKSLPKYVEQGSSHQETWREMTAHML